MTLSGLSTWGRKVGRKFDQIKINDPNADKLHYVVTPPSPASSSIHARRESSICSNNHEEQNCNNLEDTWSQQTAASSASTNDLHTTGIVHKLYFTLLLYFKHSQPLSTKSWLEKSSTKIFVEAFGSISWMNLLMNTLSAESWAYTNKGFIEEMHPKASAKNFCWRFLQSAFCS